MYGWDRREAAKDWQRGILDYSVLACAKGVAGGYELLRI